MSNNRIRLDQLDLEDLTGFVISGADTALLNAQTGIAGTQSFAVAIPSGVEKFEINYPLAYATGIYPKVVLVLENNYSEPTFAYHISGKNNTGFTLVLSNFTRSAHYTADVLSKI